MKKKNQSELTARDCFLFPCFAGKSWLAAVLRRSRGQQELAGGRGEGVEGRWLFILFLFLEEILYGGGSFLMTVVFESSFSVC